MPDIVFAWRDSGCLFRRRHFEYLCDYYSTSFNIIVADSNKDEEFNVSVARNNGVEQSSGDVVAVFDADNYMSHEQILTAIDTAANNNVLVKPFNHYGYLTQDSTEKFYAGQRSFLEYESQPQAKFNGGAWIIKRDLWNKVGAMDIDFPGWGAEDDAFHITCERQLGETIWIEGNCYHLYHPAYRVTSKANYDRLMREYVNKK